MDNADTWRLPKAVFSLRLVLRGRFVSPYVATIAKRLGKQESLPLGIAVWCAGLAFLRIITPLVGDMPKNLEFVLIAKSFQIC